MSFQHALPPSPLPQKDEPNKQAVAARASQQAVQGKIAAAKRGYFKDPFLEKFALPGLAPKPPEINYGNFFRVRFFEIVIQRFLEEHDGRCQIVNLGAGFDTTFFRLMASGQVPRPVLWFEVDLARIVTEKIPYLQGPPFDGMLEDPRVTASRLRASPFLLAVCDLSKPEGVAQLLREVSPHLPTLFLCETVINYLQPNAADALLAALAAHFTRTAPASATGSLIASSASGPSTSLSTIGENGSLLSPEVLLERQPDARSPGPLAPCTIVAYDQTHATDRFSAVMLDNLRLYHGITLPSLVAAPRPADQVARAERAGFTHTAITSTHHLFNGFLSDADRAHCAELERLDELEQFALVMRHYSVLAASTAPLSAWLTFARDAAWMERA